MNKLKLNKFLKILLIITGLLCVADCAQAKKIKGLFGKSSIKSEIDIYDMSIDDNLENPVLGKQAPEIANFQLMQAKKLKKIYHLNVETMRDGEVVVITIPASQLFAPNDTVVTELGKLTLQPFKAYLQTRGLYKVILAMHSDNTGNDAYTFDLTRDRVNAVFDWFSKEDPSRTDYVVPYALGSSEPLYPNNSMDNRKENRRLEIYLVPNTLMIEQAKKGSINL